MSNKESPPEDPLLARLSRELSQPKGRKRMCKSYFVERRSFWHLFHSFDRVWIFLVAMLQALTLIAFSGPSNSNTLLKVFSVFPTIAVLQTLQGKLLTNFLG